MTVHVSKGLEFETVYCPFLWRARAIRQDQNVIYHEAADDGETLLPAVFARLLASRDRPTPEGFTAAGITAEDVQNARALAARENLEEDLRLFYVAVTRAASKLVIFVGRTGSRSTVSAADHALFRLHAGSDAADDDETRIKTLENLANRAGSDALQITTVDRRLEAHPLDRQEQALQLSERMLPGGVRARPGFSLKSFTAYARAALEAGAGDGSFDDARDYDQSSRPASLEQPQADPWSIFNFPRGAEPGIFLHSLFEELFRSPDCLYRAAPERRRDLIASELLRGGYDPRWRPAIAGMIEAVLDAPLPGGRRLQQVEPGEALPELAFYYPMPREPELLVVGPGGRPSAGADPARALTDRPAGFMMGFIDLVFALGPEVGNSSDSSALTDRRYFLLDWKSNFLGNDRRNYDGPSLRRSMREARYPLQYYVYVDALDRYLAQRVRGYSYERNFGGVIYAFLRGVGELDGRRYGMFCARPSERRLAIFRTQYAGAGDS
jgi:exodeoxyribonuclease V beta subunit